MALLSNGKDIIDKEYKTFTADMYSKGHSFFTFVSDSADSLSSCCRLKNELTKNEFSFTNGLTGVATGSKSVITLNLNRIIQDWSNMNNIKTYSNDVEVQKVLSEYLITVLNRVHKYHIAYNELLWELYEKGMLPVYSQGFINLNQQFLTIGINGLNEAAEFLHIKINDNIEYQSFCNLILNTINVCNREAEKNPYNEKHILKFNTEFVPAENLAIKNYDWDKEDGYVVPESRNLYNSYFYLPEDTEISILDKFKLHGRKYTTLLDGGVALHCNLEEHASFPQYLKLIELACKEGTSYFTFNIPNTECLSCGNISKQYVKECPKCKSKDLTWWTRIIG